MQLWHLQAFFIGLLLRPSLKCFHGLVKLLCQICFQDSLKSWQLHIDTNLALCLETVVEHLDEEQLLETLCSKNFVEPECEVACSLLATCFQQVMLSFSSCLSAHLTLLLLQLASCSLEQVDLMVPMALTSSSNSHQPNPSILHKDLSCYLNLQLHF